MKYLCFSTAVLFAWLIVIPVQLKAGNPIDKEFKRNIISFNLATPFDPSFPRLRLGYTYAATGFFSQTFELGYGGRKLFPDSTFYTQNTLNKNYRLWEIRTESRYYFAGIRKYVIPYAAFELYYIRHRQTMFDGSFAPSGTDDLEINYERADYLRTKAGFNMKTGLIFRMGPVMAMELYGGFGLRMKNNRYTNVSIIDTGFGPGWFDDWNYYYYEGIRWSLNLTAGIKLNFMF
jgi:hypothetical protein